MISEGKITFVMSEVNYILKYNKTENIILSCNNTSKYYCFYFNFNKCCPGKDKRALSKITTVLTYFKFGLSL